ncbi:multicopper oxidase domain-containing protein [endosymbiont of Lamellibrachia barhami]|uniref:multicopper oxidase domain-containing protein n=1 Tax=endosymbiont of Lamellibrachia barhami TaxID=205975 RepID=UPI0015B01823|nr:multicopper oxidase domain-containing protein [endosymbiont of Lamellibrachia barhami]
MIKIRQKTVSLLSMLLLGMAMTTIVSQAMAAGHDIRGIKPQGGTTFNLYAFPFNMNLPDGSSMYMWGFGDMNGGANASHPAGNGYSLPQYPAPTLIVNEGDTITINVTNFGVAEPVSMVIAGHKANAVGGTPGLVTRQAGLNETVAYTFTASKAGTYLYHSMGGINPGLHTEMGLVGALIVRPTGFDSANNRIAYGATTEYEQEFLYLLTEMDPDVHVQMERGHYSHFTNSDRQAAIWFVNGRVFPDLFQGDYNPLFPHQPYQSLSLSHAGDKVLVRAVNAGHDSHPFHFHGENLRFIARDGRLLSSDGGVTPDLGRSDNTLNSAPKQTVDMIWTWTGKNLNWDIYGPVATNGCTDSDHNMLDDTTGAACHDNICNDGDGDGFDDVNHEYCADHGKALPVALPGVQDLALGGWWSGSPFLGDTGDLPPGEGGLNPFGGYFLVWHSHAEKELTTWDIFPGGSLSTMVIVPPYVPIQ